MVNNQDFIIRLKKVLQYHELTASLFADKVMVQRSSISHILSGRNKPSLDFILKVTAAFPDVDIYWLLNGKGQFPKITETITEASAPSLSQTNMPLSNTKKIIKRIVVFYSDGSFEEYKK